MSKQPSAALKRAIAASEGRTAPSEDKLEAIRQDMRAARDLEIEIALLAERLGECNGKLQKLLTETIPGKFEEVGIDRLGLLPEGNLPGYDAQLNPYYKAAIPAAWPEERQEKAFDYLDEHHAGDLVNCTFTVVLGRGSTKEQAKLRAALQKTKIPYGEKKAVNHNSLTAWVKEQIEKHQTMPDLETLGAKVGKIIKLKPRKES